MPDLPTYAWAAVALILLALAALLGRLWRRQRRVAVIDGSNVMHWRNAGPDIGAVEDVVLRLRALGYDIGVIFDANAGYKIAGRYLNDSAIARLLGLRPDRIIVVPKGEQADPWLLTFAQRRGAKVVSNDRFRDRLAQFPELAEPGRLIRGGYRDGTLWLDLPEA